MFLMSFCLFYVFLSKNIYLSLGIYVLYVFMS